MSENKKYYWLKLKETFFDSEEMKILESMENGTIYQNLYLKICLISLKSNGALLFKDMIPYNLEMIATITRTNIDIVRAGLQVFEKLKLITITDNEVIYMTDIQTLIGKSSTESDRVSKYRKTLKDNSNNSTTNQEESCNNSVEKLQESYASDTPEKEREKEKDTDKDTEREKEPLANDEVEILLNHTQFLSFEDFERAYVFWFTKLTGKPITLLNQTVSTRGENFEKLDWLKKNFEARRVHAGIAIFETLEYIAQDKTCIDNYRFRSSSYLDGIISRLVDAKLAESDPVSNEGKGKYRNPSFDYFKY
ncbi:phage replisome organizer N-terminal domain-containing protein [Brachyspira pilosicoli]|uniref:Phage replisome organizer N-terminal domain-containing protein n=1 Tax=Brachyspira pilosicoli TaxID=52584 RepID=A0AAJ6G7Z0_BRAPL|nr:phage replisome organizer N-terminal domain-containing protein [Brachyspira pilosicoli]WIH89322.1 phage replisome organizer N-terminal domain-containing protein [Brachyspira pilosicoli]WIH91617.1 phage replisome organizer N-terminal domain-containing protein [Brachyspira pilosicoli]WIH94571.1 phage replisome organizer N-terminal domain-containing protein [Brachyspira pilosicoli]